MRAVSIASAAADQSRTEQALLAAQRYYAEGVAMEVIAQELETSRSTVSRLLSFARETGLVEIRVLPPHTRVSELEALLSERYSVAVNVVHVPPGATGPERLERTALHTAGLLGTIFESDMILGLSWGTMLNAVSQYLTPKATTNTQIVQLNGFGNPRASGVHYANSMFSAFSAAFGAYVQQLPLPLFFDTEQARDIMFRERSIRHIAELQASADVVLFNVGTVAQGVPSSPYLNGYFLDDDDFALLKEDDAVGDVATIFLSRRGSYDDVRFNRRTSAPDPQALLRVRHRVCAVSGDHKVDALHAALIGGFVTQLVIDERTAELLIAHGRGGAAAG